MAKKAAKKKVAAPKKAKVALVLQSRVKDVARTAKVRVSGDFMDAANEAVLAMVKKAIERAKANNRATLRPADL